MSNYYKRISVRRGKELEMRAEIFSPSPDYQIHFYIMDDLNGQDAAYVEKHSGSGITYEGNTASWVVDDIDIAALVRNYYSYVWQVVYEDGTGNRSPVDIGTLTILGGN